ncbi:MAG: hypothetical protein WA395_15135 [Nitrososphaeraceae archaeon]
MSPIFTILALSGICVSIAISNYAFSYAQKTFAAIIPTIKILSPYKGQKVPTAENLVVSGTSSYDRSKDCRVSVLLNGIRPYQNTTATGNYGVRDYSTWRYKLDPIYTAIREGSNRLTAKITCLGNPYSFTKWTSVDLIGTREDNDKTTTTGVAQPMPLQISITVDKNPITAGDIQTITVKVHSPGITYSAISGAKVSGKIIDLSSFSSSSFPSKNMNTVVEQFGGNTDENGEVSYSWKVPEYTPIGTPYIIKVDASYGKYNGRSESNIFTVKPSSTNDDPFILAQANRNFTNGLNHDIKNFTQEIFDRVRNSLENNLR